MRQPEVDCGSSRTASPDPFVPIRSHLCPLVRPPIEHRIRAAPKSGTGQHRPTEPVHAASLHEVHLRRGVHDPTGPHHGHRPAGRHRPRRDDRVGRRLARRRRPASAVCLPAARERARRRGAARARGRGAARPPSVGHVRRLRGDGRLPGRRPGPRRGSRDQIAPGGAAALSEQQGLLDGRGRRALDPADLARLERAGFAATGVSLRCPVSAAGAGARRISAPRPSVEGRARHTT